MRNIRRYPDAEGWLFDGATPGKPGRLTPELFVAFLHKNNGRGQVSAARKFYEIYPGSKSDGPMAHWLAYKGAIRAVGFAPAVTSGSGSHWECVWELAKKAAR